MDKTIWDYTHEDPLAEPEVGTEWMKVGRTPYDFIYGYAYDEILEDSINEKCVIKALKRLIPKADTDAEELERNLVSLQTELACIEIEEWSDMCCITLRDKINGLERSLRSLRNKSAKATQLRLSIPMRPAEKVEDILKGLLRKNYPEKDQHLDVISLDLKSEAAEHPNEYSEKTVQSQSNSDIAKKSGEGNTPIEIRTRMNSSPDHQGTGGPKRLKPTPKNSVDPDSDSILVADSDGEKKLDTVNPGPDLTLVSSDEEKILVTADSTEVTGLLEVREQTSVSMDGTTKESKSHTSSATSDLPVRTPNIQMVSLKDEQRKSAEPAEATLKASVLRSLKYSKECVNVVKSLCKSDTKANQVSEVKVEATTKDDATAPKDLHPERDQTQGKTNEPQKGIVEYTSLDDFIERAACNGKNRTSLPKSSTSSNTGAKDSDLDEKIVELRTEITGKEGITGPKTRLGIEKTTIGVKKERKPDIGPDFIDPYQPKADVSKRLQSLFGNRKSQPDSQSATKKPEVKLDQKPQSPRAKRKSQSESESVKGKGVTPTPSKQKRQKIDDSEDTACLNDVFGKNQKKFDVPKPFKRDHLASLTQPLGTKSILDQPVSPKTKELVVDLKIPDSNGNSSGKNPMKKNNPNAVVALVPSNHDEGQDMTHMKVAELKAIAKDLHITGCSKMKKQDLVETIKAKRNEMSQR